MPSDQRVVSIDQIEATPNVIDVLKKIQKSYHCYTDIEARHQLTFTENSDLSWDLCELMMDWCKADTEDKCKKVYFLLY